MIIPYCQKRRNLEDDLGPMLALSSDSESDSEDESEGDSEDEDDIPVRCYGTNILNPTISRKPADETEDRNLPGCPGIWTGTSGHNHS